MHQEQLSGTAGALRRAVVWAGARATTTRPVLEGLGGQAAEAGMPGQGRGNLPTSPSFAVVLLPSCSTSGFGASLVCPGSTERHSHSW